MSFPSLLLGMTAAAVSAIVQAAVPHPPRPPDTPPSIHDLGRGREPQEAIFTYRVNGSCEITDTRKLQGDDAVQWSDVAQARALVAEDTVFRYVNGVRTQLRERRVKLLGEMVRDGELVCHVKPAGEVVEAWIERMDDSTARRRSPEREDVPVRAGEIPDLGTFSLVEP